MNSPPFEWPYRDLMFVLYAIAAAVIVPWFIPRARRRLGFSIVPSLIAAVYWYGYEQYLHSIARVGDPLIRVDWMLLAPLMGIALLSAVASVGTPAVSRRVKSNEELEGNKQKT